MTSLPLVSVIIPAYNGESTLRLTLESLIHQDYPNIEAIVISDGSRDRTVGITNEFDTHGIRVIDRKENRGLGATLREGIANTKGPILMFLHQDCELLSPSWIRQAVTHLEDEKVGWVTGHYETLSPEKTHLVDQAFALLRGEFLPTEAFREPIHPVAFSEGKCDLIRRNALESIGGIPVMLRTSGEDQLLSYTLRSQGWIILKDTSLVVQQQYLEGSPLTLIKANLKKEFLYGKTQAVINLKHWHTILNDLTKLSFAARKGFHPTVKAGAFTITVMSLAYTTITGLAAGLGPLLALWVAMLIYYLWKCHYSGIRLISPLAGLVVILGFASFIPYGVALTWGVTRFILMKLSIYTKPI
jgi:glycosyltransferase involved in cell wall biosynthesis